MDHGHLFATDRFFNSKIELVNWAKETAMKVNTYLIVIRYLRSRTSDRLPYVTLGCERGGANKPRTKPRVDDEEEEEVPIKIRGPYKTKKCGCPFKLKGEQMAMYNMPLLETVGMILTGKEQDGSPHEPCVIITDMESGLIPMIEKYLDTVFLNTDSPIEGQIADIKSSLEFSRLKEKFNAKSKLILKNVHFLLGTWQNNIILLSYKCEMNVIAPFTHAMGISP
ncbi:hypothetical protein M9H77_26250 [Catharanthus roseus]|uniref:Uncharacterized protein n=1 Tax=Catharanthus roseus TaxID=4058 RepID=A0ACC0AAI2_CATRO|nr:hypothetical protein M9H77_26250 [Catharanthus roseus]